MTSIPSLDGLVFSPKYGRGRPFGFQPCRSGGQASPSTAARDWGGPGVVGAA
jgi:hypothetical protein